MTILHLITFAVALALWTGGAYCLYRAHKQLPPYAPRKSIIGNFTIEFPK